MRREEPDAGNRGNAGATDPAFRIPARGLPPAGTAAAKRRRKDDGHAMGGA